MSATHSDLSTELLAALAQRGVADSGVLQAALGRSQATVSRLLAGLSAQMLVLGAGRRTRYALPHSILGLSAQQPLLAVHEDGRVEHWGRLSFLQGQRVHVQAPGIDVLLQGQLPWFLAPLRGEGYLGRALARTLAAWGLPANPEQWTLEQTLYAAVHAPNSPGALQLGEGPPGAVGSGLAGTADSAGWGPSAMERASASPATDPLAEWDAQADAASHMGHPGSSAGGEQAKFLADDSDGSALLVKFSPPHPSPFGTRWHDLLHAEALALAVLGAHGVAVAQARMVTSARRTFLASHRFDRHGRHGRSHVVPLHAVHDAFVPGPRQHWAATSTALVQQRRLPAPAAAQVRALQQFGRLIGNTDMHFGNLSLRVALPDLAHGRFTLAPMYDMLPMRWRPNTHSGELSLLPFTPEPADLQSAARPVALEFWRRCAQSLDLSDEFRELARVMVARLAG
jgi:HipA-like C-terminal domain